MRGFLLTPLTQSQETSPVRMFSVFSTRCSSCSSSSHHRCSGHCSHHWVLAAPQRIHPGALGDALSCSLPFGAWQGQASPCPMCQAAPCTGRARSASTFTATKAAADTREIQGIFQRKRETFPSCRALFAVGWMPSKPCPIAFAFLELRAT